MRTPTVSTAFLTTLTIVASAGVTLAAASPASAATCSDVHAVFARGTGEPQGLGLVGGPFVRSLTSALAGRSVTSYAVTYAADVTQTSAVPGSGDMVAHISGVAAACPDTQFVIGGYSQGATVATLATGTPSIATGGTVIPAALADRVSAVVVFGNPLGLLGRTLETASATYGPKSKSFCATGDPVCGGGADVAAHLSYGGAPATEGAQFAASKIAAAPAPVVPAPVVPAPVAPAPVPVTPPTAAPAGGIDLAALLAGFGGGTGTGTGAATGGGIDPGALLAAFGGGAGTGTGTATGSGLDFGALLAGLGGTGTTTGGTGTTTGSTGQISLPVLLAGVNVLAGTAGIGDYLTLLGALGSATSGTTTPATTPTATPAAGGVDLLALLGGLGGTTTPTATTGTDPLALLAVFGL